MQVYEKNLKNKTGCARYNKNLFAKRQCKNEIILLYKLVFIFYGYKKSLFYIMQKYIIVNTFDKKCVKM